MAATDRRMKLALLAITLLAWGLRLYRLDTHPLRGDEAFSAVVASQLGTPAAAAGLVADPLAAYDFALGLWARAVGNGEFSLRALSALAGALAVPLLYRVARLLGFRFAALLAAGFLALNPYQIFHAQDVRSYAPWVALDLAALSFLLLAVQSDRARYWVAYGIFVLLALLTHFGEGLILAFTATWFLAMWWGLSRGGEEGWAVHTRRPRRMLWRWGLTVAAVGGAYALYLALGPAQLVPGAAVATAPSLPEMAGQLMRTLTFGETLPPGLADASLPLAGMLMALGIISAWRRDRRAGLLLLLWILVPWLGTWIYVQWRPVFRERYLTATAPALFLGYAVGILALYRLAPRFRAGVTVAGAGIVVVPAAMALATYFGPTYQKAPDWPGLTAQLARRVDSRDLVAATYPDPALEYYWRGSAETTVLPRTAEPTDDEIHRNLQDLLARHERVWLIEIASPAWDAEGRILRWLDRLALRTEETELAGFTVLAYESLAHVRDAIQYRTAWTVGEVALLVGYDLGFYRGEDRDPVDLAQVGPSGGVHLVLYWEALRATDTSYHIFTHILGPGGAIWGQKDNPPQGGDFPTILWRPGDLIRDEYWIPLVPEAPAGAYALNIGMYEFGSGDRLPIFDSRGQPAGDAISLRRFTTLD